MMKAKELRAMSVAELEAKAKDLKKKNLVLLVLRSPNLANSMS